MSKGKVIISCAVTGAIHTPSMSPHLPVTAQEIADSAVAAAEAGAAIIHLHARNPQDGRPDQNPDLFEPFLKVIKQRSDAVINITTGGHPSMTLRSEEHTSELQSLMRISYAVFCLKKKIQNKRNNNRK